MPGHTRPSTHRLPPIRRGACRSGGADRKTRPDIVTPPWGEAADDAMHPLAGSRVGGEDGLPSSRTSPAVAGDGMSAAYPELLMPARLWSRAEVLGIPCPVPRAPGVYAWYFRDIPSRVPTTGCVTHRGLTLLYVGIAPRAPRGNGSGPSRQTLRDRIKMHMRGPAEGSTLRISLGCLLAEDLGLQLRRVGGGRRTTFTAAGERALSAWMERNAFVTWLVSATPWTVEEELIRGLSLPLNLHHNRHHPFRPVLSALRSAAKAEAQALPIVQES